MLLVTKNLTRGVSVLALVPQCAGKSTVARAGVDVQWSHRRGVEQLGSSLGS